MPMIPTAGALLAAAALLGVTSSGMAQIEPCDGPVLPPRTIEYDGSPVGVEMADIDNDGRLDIIVIGEVDRDEGVLILRQEDDGTYDHSFYPTSSICPTDIGLADLNGDGFVDLCILMQCAGRADVFLNNGAGGFVRTAEPLETDRRPWDHVIDDIDGDGDLDIVVVCLDDDTINVFRGDGAGGFGPAESRPTVGTPAFLELADHNQDGRPDLILSGEDGFSVMYSLGDGAFSEPELLQALSGPTFFATIADVNTDGRWDIVASWASIVLFIQQVDGSFDRLIPRDSSAWYPQVVVGDFDGNGHLDLVGMDGAVVEMLLGTGDLQFQYRQHRVLHDAEDGLAAGDIDNDGDLDIVTIDNWRDPMNVLRNLSNAWFTPVFELRGPLGTADLRGAHGIAPIDLDANPFVDFVIAAGDADQVAVYRNRGDGRSYIESAVDVGRRPRDVATGDLDGDGFGDVVSANELSDDVSVLLNTLRGQMFDETRVPAGNGPVAVELGDLDHDGDLDAVVAAISSNAVQVLLNDGSGALQWDGAYPTGIRPVDVKLADANGDGVLDCLVANEFHDDLSVLIGRSDGTFQSQQRFHAGDKPVSLACGDINRDGTIDVVVALEKDCSAVLMLGDGTGGFDAGAALPAGSGLGDVRLFDADGDRDLDLVVSSSDAQGIYAFRNDGTGQFQAFALAQTDLARPSDRESPRALATGDFDRDGSVDIVAANGPEGSYSVMFNRIVQTCPTDIDGDGTLTIFDFLTFGNLFDLMDPRADFDRDGDFTIFDFLAFQNAFDAGCP